MGITIGKEIDGYHVLEVLGQGGMGVVYLAEDVALSRKVALKVIDPALARDESFLRRFRAEARALARIDSPYIVRVHALRQTDFGVFIVMEYVDGGTLSDLIRKGPMTWQQAVPLIKQMLHAFSHAHGVGVIHRDIKPGNIMLTAEGGVKVADFGLAKLHQQNVDATVTQGISGTLFYMSPEQVKGQRDLDHRTDLYSFGMTVYEMLAGRVPLERNEGEFAVLKRIVEEKPPPPSRFAPDLPDDLVHIVMKALEKDPARRYQSADSMLEDVVAFEEGMATRSGAKIATSSRRTTGIDKRRPLFIGGAAALVVLLVIVGFLGYRTWFSGGSPPLLTVTTMPEGVMVYLGDRFIGETPLRNQAIEEGPVAMRLIKGGFVTVDTTLLAEQGRPLALDVRMAAASDLPSTSVTVMSNPSDAEVWIDGRMVGRTPYIVEDARPGTMSFELRKQGYENLELHEEIEPDGDNTFTATLGPVERRTTGRDETSDDSREATTGSLTVSADVAGHIEVDGRTVRASEPITLERGAHTVACGQAPHRIETRVTVAPGRSHEITCHFITRVNVVATTTDGPTPWASLWINGRNLGSAPAELKLEPGSYRVAVRREGYTVLDEEKALNLKPGLEPQTVQLAFRIRKE